MMVSKKDIEAVLKTIPDPELGVSLWDLGLIHDIKVKDNRIYILMTLTTIGCPLFSLIETPIKQELGKMPGVAAVEVELTFDPPWSIDRLSDNAKEQLGMV